MKWQDMTEGQRHQTLRTMERMGGGFAGRLAEAWFYADHTNSERLAAAFPELIEKYQPREETNGIRT